MPPHPPPPRARHHLYFEAWSILATVVTHAAPLFPWSSLAHTLYISPYCSVLFTAAAAATTMPDFSGGLGALGGAAGGIGDLAGGIGNLVGGGGRSHGGGGGGGLGNLGAMGAIGLVGAMAGNRGHRGHGGHHGGHNGHGGGYHGGHGEAAGVFCFVFSCGGVSWFYFLKTSVHRLTGSTII